MRALLTVWIVGTAVAVGAGSDQEMRFSLQLAEELARSPVDPRTEARLAQWDSPMGRLAYEMQQQQALIMRGGQPGGAAGLGFRLKLQSGLGLKLTVAPVDTGVDLYERSIAPIRWPWLEDDRPALSIEEQLSLMLGRRLESHPGGSSLPERDD